ncbi:hypothetical protein FNV43_RR04498 [Rhamnella rubrinervis]|uniref:Phytocyanin domain-containing protein n=1 Tax=Rhamnella rubrinervis TaxID=2594499 RepID=A0A8K0HJM9_9ROSA|nr:hypothetical protein FNV43_RR04498 [Rhamnella rubrinervis]
MADLRKRLLVYTAASIMIAMKLLSAECRDPVLHRVGGGRFTWNPDINFTEWSSHEHFYVGDWLYFGFDKKMYNVLEVNKTSYEKCIEREFIMNITKGGRDVFNLTEPKTYYFLDGRGHCFKGMKVAVPVEQYFPPIIDTQPPLLFPPNNNNNNPQPVFLNNGFPLYACTHIILISTALAFSFLF